MKTLGRSYIWSFWLGLPAALFVVSGCAGDSATPGGSGGSTNPGSGGSTLVSGGATSFGGSTGTGGGSIQTSGGNTTAMGGSSTALGGGPTASGGTTTPGSGGVATTSGGSTTTPGTGGTSVGGTGSGGTTSTAGASTAGAGGGGPKVKLCAAKAPAPAVFVDFETYDGKADVAMWAFSHVMGAYAGFWPGGTPVPTLSMLGGHAGNYGLNVSVMSATGSWAGLGTWMSAVTCVDASAFKGVTLWVRGTTPTGFFSVHVNTEDTTLPDAMDPAGGGTCTGTAETCKAPTAADLPVSVDWTQVTIPWAMFTGGMNGTTAVTLTGDKITGLGINFGFMYGLNPNYVATDPTSQEYIPLPGNIDFTFDDLGFSM
jgi:hypothetical protein